MVQGWRPTSAVNQPVKIAMNGSGKLRNVAHSSGRFSSMRPLAIRYDPVQASTSMISQQPTMILKAKERDEHRRPVLTRKIGQPDLLGGEAHACDQAAQDGDRERISVALRRGIGDSNEDFSGWLLVMPAGFDGGELGRLMLMDVVAIEMPEVELHRQEY